MKITLLDHGYVEFIEPWGRGKACAPQFKELDEGKGECSFDYEVGIIEAARQSTQGSFRGWETDEKLLEFLYSNSHMTPFEFSGMVIEVQAPIFVFREWHRHRTQSYNEMSARYAPLPDLYYVPTAENTAERYATAMTTSNRQASGILRRGESIEGVEVRAQFLKNLEEGYARFEEEYQWALRNGIPKELARLGMPVGHYSRMRCCTNLRNWLAFLTLRQAPNAQWEIRQYANAVAQIISQVFPRTYKLFVDRAPPTA